MDLRREDGSIQDITMVFSDRRTDSPQHYRNQHPDDQRLVDRRLEELEAERIRDPELRDPELKADFKTKFGCEMGFNVEALGKSFGLRDLGSINYYYR